MMMTRPAKPDLPTTIDVTPAPGRDPDLRRSGDIADRDASTVVARDGAAAVPSRGRRVLAGVAVAATLPYLALKLSWLLGSRVGLNDPEFGRSTTMQIANGLTLAMEACAAALAVAFVARWGRRLPAYLVLIPMWVATGLLGAILLILPLQLVLLGLGAAGTDGSGTAGGPEPAGPIADWVYAVVYGGFSVLGVALLAGFALYARDRWLRPGGWSGPLSAARRVGAATAATSSAVAAAALLVAAGEVATGAHAGPGLANTVGSALFAAVAAAGLAGLAARRPGRARGLGPLLAVWVGSGALAAWGLYTTVLFVVPNDLAPGGQPVYVVGFHAAKAVVGVVAALLLPRLQPRGSGAPASVRARA